MITGLAPVSRTWRTGGITICRAAALAYLAVTDTVTLLRLLSVSEREKHVEILALRHHVLVLQRQHPPGHLARHDLPSPAHAGESAAEVGTVAEERGLQP